MGRQALASCSCFVLGVAFTWWLLGPMAFDPSAIQWLLSGDRGQSFLGWHLARNEPLGFPLGRIPSYVYPAGASLALTDSYPWFRLLLLPASPLLGAVFQHAGLWLALCYGLLALFSFHVLRFLTRDRLASVVATSLVVANPVLLARKGHLSATLPDLPNGAGQHEGFAYLGLAPLRSAPRRLLRRDRDHAASSPRRARPREDPSPLRLGALLVVVAGCAVFALSSRPMLGTIELARLGDA